MKAPVGLLSDRTVLRSKMEGPCPDKFTFGVKIGRVVEGCRLIKGCIKKWVRGSANGQLKLSTVKEAIVKNMEVPYEQTAFLPPSGGVFRLSHLGVIAGYPMQTVMRLSRCNGQNGNKKAVTKQTSPAFAFSGRSC